MDWQPIESAPKRACIVAFFHGNEPLDCLPDDQYSTGYFEPCPAVESGFGPCCEGSFDWDDNMTEPTHWMPLPEPPTASIVVPASHDRGAK